MKNYFGILDFNFGIATFDFVIFQLYRNFIQNRRKILGVVLFFLLIIWIGFLIWLSRG